MHGLASWLLTVAQIVNSFHLNFTDEYDVRLVNKKRLDGIEWNLHGILQMFYNDSWGYICGDNWYRPGNNYVVCRALGYNWLEVVEPLTWPVRDEPVWESDLKCDGLESSLGQCPNDGWRRQRACTKRAIYTSCWKRRT